MLVFGGVVFNQADKMGTFYCDKLICVDNVESGAGFYVSNLDASYLTIALNGTTTLYSEGFDFDWLRAQHC